MRVRALNLGAASAIAIGALGVPASASLIVPAHSSLPGAPATLYLDFDGDFTANFGSFHNFTTPAYDIDDNTSSFSPQELSNIDHIWSGVAEKYSPFNLNVTTVDPGVRNDGHVMAVDIGGTGSWTGGLSGGIASVGGFVQGFGTAYAFSSNLGLPRVGGLIVPSPNHAKYVAEAVSHEAGHGFGLVHQRTFDSDNNFVEEYNTNNNSTVNAPIMGNSYAVLRGQWWYGTTASLAVKQDDLAKITQMGSGTNNFGYRADDHPNTFADADPASVASDLAITAQGVIERSGDVDVFKFFCPGGIASIFANANSDNPMLDLSLKLMDSNGITLATSAQPAGSTPDTLRESILATLDPGYYEIAVNGATALNPLNNIVGGYDVGQYYITGFAAPEPACLGSLLGGCALLLRRRRPPNRL